MKNFPEANELKWFRSCTGLIFKHDVNLDATVSADAIVAGSARSSGETGDYKIKHVLHKGSFTIKIIICLHWPWIILKFCFSKWPMKFHGFWCAHDNMRTNDASHGCHIERLHHGVEAFILIASVYCGLGLCFSSKYTIDLHELELSVKPQLLLLETVLMLFSTIPSLTNTKYR